jgi:hypothetical protein
MAKHPKLAKKIPEDLIEQFSHNLGAYKRPSHKENLFH